MEDTPSHRDSAGAQAWQLIEPHVNAVNIYDGPDVFLAGFEKLPGAVQRLFAVWWCDSEVCNGGFHQFFSNSTGVLAPEAIEGFQAVSLHDCARAADAAIRKFGDSFPRERQARLSALQAIELPGESRKGQDPFSDLDDRYYAARLRERLEEKLDDYARRHAR